MNSENVQTSSVVNAALKLSRDLTQGVLDVILSNASRIPSFKARRNQLTEVNQEYLAYYTLGLVLFCSSITHCWGEQEVNAQLEVAADYLSRQMVYEGLPSGAATAIRDNILDNARNFYEATYDNFVRLFGDDTERRDDIFNFMLVQLVRAFPGAMILMTECNLDTDFLSSIVQRFGTLSLRTAI